MLHLNKSPELLLSLERRLLAYSIPDFFLTYFRFYKFRGLYLSPEKKNQLPPISVNTEQELIALLKNKDRQAYSYLYDNYAGALYGIIMKVLNKEEAAKDVLQEVFVKIWQHIGSYDAGKGRLYTWMLNIARNAAIDVLRSAGFNKDKKISTLENNVYNGLDALSTAISTDHMGLKKLVGGLKEEHRQIIELAYFNGYTQEEIAQTLNIPLGTVKTRSRAALAQLKSLMN